MWKRVLLLLLLIPLADALFLVVVADFLGWQLTVLLVVLTALVGMVFVRMEGRRTIRSLHEAIEAGRAPTDQLLDGGFLIAAGAFLLTPGLVTDAIGFLLVFPVTRYLVRGATKRWVLVPYLDKRSGGFVTGRVYTGGFPGADARGDVETPIHLDEDEFEVDDSDGSEKGNS